MTADQDPQPPVPADAPGAAPDAPVAAGVPVAASTAITTREAVALRLAVCLLGAGCVVWAAAPLVHTALASWALVLAIIGVAAGVLRLVVSWVPVPEDNYLLPAPARVLLRFLQTLRAVPWEEGALMAIVWLEVLHRSRLVIFCLPLLAMFVLLIVGSLHEMPGVQPSILTDDFPGRLLFSGRLLDYWNLPQWFGFAASQVYTSDTGYAYVVNNLGLPLALFLLGIFAIQTPRTPEALSMKAMITVYMATSLCIGANMFTIKTAALCWFLYGAANTMPFEVTTVRKHLWAGRQMAVS